MYFNRAALFFYGVDMDTLNTMWQAFLDIEQFWLAAGALACAIGVAWYTSVRDQWHGRFLTPQQVYDLIECGEDPLIWDTRKSSNVKKNPLTPKGSFVMGMEFIPNMLRDKTKHRLFTELSSAYIVILDDTPLRSAMAGRMLQKGGMQNVAVMKGKMKHWIAAGFPTETVETKD